MSRTISTPVITENLYQPNDTTFNVQTPGLLIPRVDVKLLGKNSKFRLSDPLGNIDTVEYGDPEYQALYEKYKRDYNTQDALNNVVVKPSVPKAVHDVFVGRPLRQENGGNMNYLRYVNSGCVQKDGFGDVLKFGASFIPVVGTGIAAYDAIKAAKDGKWGQAALNAGLAGLSVFGLGGLGKVAKAGINGAAKLAGKTGITAAEIAGKAGKAGEAITAGAKKAAEAAGKAGEAIINKVPKGSVLEADIQSAKNMIQKGKEVGKNIGTKIADRFDPVKQAMTPEVTKAMERAKKSFETTGLISRRDKKILNLAGINTPRTRAFDPTKTSFEFLNTPLNAFTRAHKFWEEIPGMVLAAPLKLMSYRSYIPLDNEQLVIGAARAIVPTFYEN